ncbi:D-alanyl-D-alanine carboxypeptidase family protein [Tateyamaria omphalii]|uniref:glycosyl hydrolase 108 family protein n=1 Tax=Tateyamaria omphalii TaxID=299262 RepID=UPI001C9A210D|nr:glycosyl hydrolase 108 family protein [Tateyamaria omphalii]MBY5935610.1 D-alanyl-D-alanine carboxypeptidase family protein [Tateyamaria omphalii]
MSGLTKRDGEISRLHPAIRDSVATIQKKLNAEKIPFRVFEAFRTPHRQASLYAKGRTKPGNKVTWVGPWGSIHQYGLAVDFVLYENGKWSWDDSGAKAKWWARMHEVAAEHNMTPLYNKKKQLIEKPHVQLVGVTSSELRDGIYPDGGDAVWAEHLADLIDSWNGSGAPAKPPSAPEKPALDPTLVVDVDPAPTAAPTLLPSSADADERFEKLHGFIKWAEGGFANHPEDTGGATNFGITRETLEDWRGKPVTEEDVRALGREEADLILRTNYYARCRCGEMPDRTAMVVYNTAVLSGTDKAVRTLQEAFNTMGMTVNGGPLKVDGIIGRNTIAAARETDAEAMSDTYVDLYEAYLKTRHNFDTFGNGWMNRIAKLREFLTTLPKGAGKRPTTVMKVSNKPLGLDLDADDLLSVIAAVSTGGKSAAAKLVLNRIIKKKVAQAEDDSVTESLLKAALEERLDDLEPETPTPDKPPLTPVNAALGETVGRLLNGRKSVIGIVGLVLTSVVPTLFPEGGGIIHPDLLKQFEDNPDIQTILFTLLSIFTGWGFLGKIDKAIRDVRAEI